MTTTTADPFRWLEADDADVLAWQRAQAAAAAETVGAWPHLNVLAGLLGRLGGGPPPVLPVPAAGRWFRAEGADLIASTEPLGPGDTVARLPAGERAAWLAPSPDGTVLAVGIGQGGGEENAIRLLDTGSGEPLGHGPDRLLFDALLGGVSWLPDSSGFHYLGMTAPVDRFEQAIFRYDLRSRTEHAEPIPRPSPDYTLVQAGDGRWTVAAHGLLTPLPVAVHDRADPDGGWRPFLTSVPGVDGPLVAGYPIGDEYVAWTDVGAPRGRVVAIRFDADDPGDPSAWRELLPEGDGVIVALLRTRAALYTVELVDGRWSRVRELDGAGGRVLPLPPRVSVRTGVAALHALARPGSAPELLLPSSSPSRSWTVSGWRPGDQVPRLLADATTGLPGAVVEERQAVGADGTLIPYTCLYRPDERGQRPRPTLITAYGGFYRALTPEWSDDAAAVAASGGLHVWAHTRGGGDLGREWWEGGRRGRKQTVLDDLHAVAADLVATGRADPSRLAVVGRSHGGWLAGAAAVTRPDVWRAAVPLVPALDLVTDLRTPYGKYVTELDWPDGDAEEHVAALSPYHLIRPGSYPAVYLAAGDRDPRCPAWHARKFAARLQEAQQGPGAVLLRVRENAGHGLTSSAAERRRDAAEWLGFVFAELGLVPPAAP
ncbi:prolyl oligopeptidase family serine peptidase [Jiangella alba]|uniref:Prolyl oligopeptidase n=1 Tax=Jiangella alba TaxID=561176 RepID=A0A1H5M0S7_9ACTN|nr:prolyl oligopeptidase family serine peptidase [Jiangella alba]SEE82148.1 prolyl oligopeptidase [Jiangella alba]